MLRFHILTLFPESFSYLSQSIIGRAQKRKKISVSLYAIRDFTTDKHRTTDDKPYGGGPGMVLKAEPILRAVKKIKGKKKGFKVIVFATDGKQFTNGYAQKLLHRSRDIILIAGHYEGVDERVVKALKAEKISIGSYVLSGGELPAMVVVDAIARRIPGVLGKTESLEELRVSSPEVYTRPESFMFGKKTYSVPKVLLSGHHKKIDAWRAQKRR
ncbi:MAG: tRNA (guanosine(37)-N1)-methyltransferase TrmD [Patescibacteria group bacterium]